MEGLILAAGKGSRLSPAGTSGFCKALVEIDGKPLIAYSLENLNRLDVKRATVVIGKKHGRIISTLGSHYKNISLNYVVQEKPIGLVNAMISAKSILQEDFVLQLSDEIFLRSDFESTFLPLCGAYDFVVGYTPDSDEKIKQNFSLETDDRRQITHCTEKPKQVVDNRKGTGFCYFSHACYDLLLRHYDEPTNTPCDLCDFINLLTAKGKKGTAVKIAEKEINVNKPDDYQLATLCLKSEKPFE